MRILQVIPFFTASRGGSVVVLHNLSKQLVNRGHEVTIITTDFEFDENYASNLNVMPFRCTSNLGLFLYSPRMREWLRENINDFDVLHLHNFRSYQNNLIQYFSKKYEIPYILQAHGSLPRIAEKQSLKWIYDQVWGYRILHGASRFLAVSDIEMEQYKAMKINQTRIDLIPNGLDIDCFKYLPKYGTFKRKISVDSNSKMILYIGRLHKIKGIDFLIRSFKILMNNRKNTVLVIAGPDDGYGHELKTIVNDLGLNDSIRFVQGYIKNVVEAYRDADVLVYPSQYEIFGLVPFEAIMCGTPVIVTDNSHCGNIIQKYNCGHVIKYGDINGLAKKINDILENPDESISKIVEGKKYITENLNWKEITSKLEAIYRNCK